MEYEFRVLCGDTFGALAGEGDSMSGVTVPVVAHAGHLYGLTGSGVYDIATYEGETA